ncbi:MAG: UDP-N-acetylmuramoyl-tripeptide--D-alanyl-D-alanine ligase [Defluviitaleaceae bacterium]|nr:UDP-N-acetylmuramoyl-tripeptide--D-alanyl-D-alanine ligase [Defluviitaleaceae bacterium]
MKLDVREIINAVGGRLLCEDGKQPENSPLVTSISTDTRAIKPGALFVPITGERFDGHDYIAQAIDGGAVCVFTEKQNSPVSKIPLVFVNSTRRALMDLADYYRRKHNVKVVAITGSAGKTTTKDMIADILSQKYKVKRTIKNFNNEIGMPLSIFQLEDDDEVLVLEMGMNHANEIHELSLVGAPDIAVITHIGDAHIENFANREGILHAKLEITDGLRTDGTVILNGDDPLLTGPVTAEKVSAYKVLYPSSKNILAAKPIGFQETRCTFIWRDKEINLTVPIPGSHMVMNALLASVAALELGCSPAQITKGFENFIPPEGRLNIFEANEMLIIDDVYNANPASMIEALKVLCRKESAQRRRIAILGDMNELGHAAKERHLETGAFAAESGLDLLITIGSLSRHIYEGFNNPAKSLHFAELSDFHHESILKQGDIVLVKASRGMAFEEIIKTLQRR